jgi:hypothetical protein
MPRLHSFGYLPLPLTDILKLFDLQFMGKLLLKPKGLAFIDITQASQPIFTYHISRNFCEDLILTLLVRVLRSLKFNIANNSFPIVIRAFRINLR